MSRNHYYKTNNYSIVTFVKWELNFILNNCIVTLMWGTILHHHSFSNKAEINKWEKNEELMIQTTINWTERVTWRNGIYLKRGAYLSNPLPLPLKFQTPIVPRGNVIYLFVFIIISYAGIGVRFPGVIARFGAPSSWHNLGGIHRFSLLPLRPLQLCYVMFCGGQKVVVSLHLKTSSNGDVI